MDLRTILEIAKGARAVHAIHKDHHRIEVSVEQETDDLGIGLQIDLQAVVPPGALLLGRIKGLWLGKLMAAEPGLFSDADGSFLTLGPIQEQRAWLYVPYGAATNRGPGLYTLEMSVELYDDAGAATQVANASYKLALPPQRPWDKVEFFRPLVRLCMAVIRVDNEILPDEIRSLKALLTANLGLNAVDMPQLRAAMKDTEHGDLDAMLASIFLRLPLMSPLDLVHLLCHVARFDGPINAHELSVIQHVAQRLELPTQEYKALLAAPQSALAARPR